MSDQNQPVTPDELVVSNVARLETLGVSDVEPCVTAEESTVFQLPMVLQR